MQYLFLFKNEWPYDPSFEIREPKDGGNISSSALIFEEVSEREKYDKGD